MYTLNRRTTNLHRYETIQSNVSTTRLKDLCFFHNLPACTVFYVNEYNLAYNIRCTNTIQSETTEEGNLDPRVVNFGDRLAYLRRGEGDCPEQHIFGSRKF